MTDFEYGTAKSSSGPSESSGSSDFSSDPASEPESSEDSGYTPPMSSNSGDSIPSDNPFSTLEIRIFNPTYSGPTAYQRIHFTDVPEDQGNTGGFVSSYISSPGYSTAVLGGYAFYTVDLAQAFEDGVIEPFDYGSGLETRANLEAFIDWVTFEDSETGGSILFELWYDGIFQASLLQSAPYVAGIPPASDFFCPITVWDDGTVSLA